jgi:uncharacterized protein
LLALAFVSLAGCAKKSLSKTQIRAVTDEVVAAAERITGRKSEISIRPEIQRSPVGAQGRLAADDIYISLREASQTGALKQALGEIADRHKLSFDETSRDGVIRFEFAFKGTRTHTIHVVAPLAARAQPRAQHPKGTAELAIILDDLGHDRSAADSLLALPFPLTISVLPHLPLSTETAEEAYRRGDQIMLHLPMESQSEGEGSEGAIPEPLELRSGNTQSQVAAALDGMLETVPHAVGVNNHQGSRATADPALMQALMPALRAKGLFFIDSRTTAATVAYDTAERTGVRAASRKVFLDDTPTREAVLAQLDLAARDALRDGSAIAIGHPHPATIAALAEGVPGLEARGIRLVFASDLVH